MLGVVAINYPLSNVSLWYHLFHILSQVEPITLLHGVVCAPPEIIHIIYMNISLLLSRCLT